MNRMVYLATEKNIQISVLEEKLKSVFPFQLISSVDLLTNTNISDGQVILIDLAAITGSDVTHLLSHLSNVYSGVILALFNTDRSQNIHTLTRFRNIKGIFYNDDSFEQLIKGITLLLDGEYWLSRKMMGSMLEFVHSERESSETGAIAKEALTRREQQILKLVSTGATNTEIANKIFLSENTVKTHLSNLYRKLDIRNRTQASLWVKNNIRDRA